MSAITLGSEFVLDTMSFVLRPEGRRMGGAAREILELAEAGSATVHVPGLVLAEILYLSERRRIVATLADVLQYFERHPSCKEHPTDLAVVRAAAEIRDVPELHDRLIAGTGLLLGIPVITNDPAIQASRFVRSIW